jgi:hypothetical protein
LRILRIIVLLLSVAALSLSIVNKASALVGTPSQIRGTTEYVNDFTSKSQCNAFCNHLQNQEKPGSSTLTEAQRAHRVRSTMLKRRAIGTAASRSTMVGATFWMGWQIGTSLRHRYFTDKITSPLGSGWFYVQNVLPGMTPHPQRSTFYDPALEGLWVHGAGYPYNAYQPVGGDCFQPWSSLNCGALPEGLVRGSITGATDSRLYEVSAGEEFSGDSHDYPLYDPDDLPLPQVPPAITEPIPGIRTTPATEEEVQTKKAGFPPPDWEEQIQEEIDSNPDIGEWPAPGEDGYPFPDGMPDPWPTPEPGPDPENPDTGTVEDPPPGEGGVPGNPDECRMWTRPRLNFDPLRVPVNSVFPFGIPFWLFAVFESMEGSAAAPTFTIDFSLGELNIDFAVVDPVVDVLRVVLLIAAIGAFLLLAGSYAFGSGGGKD